MLKVWMMEKRSNINTDILPGNMMSTWKAAYMTASYAEWHLTGSAGHCKRHFRKSPGQQGWLLSRYGRGRKKNVNLSMGAAGLNVRWLAGRTLWRAALP